MDSFISEWGRWRPPLMGAADMHLDGISADEGSLKEELARNAYARDEWNRKF